MIQSQQHQRFPFVTMQQEYSPCHPDENDNKGVLSLDILKRADDGFTSHVFQISRTVHSNAT